MVKSWVFLSWLIIRNRIETEYAKYFFFGISHTNFDLSGAFGKVIVFY